MKLLRTPALLGALLGALLALLTAPVTAQVLCGIDVLARDQGGLLRGKNLGLVTNHTGMARDGRRTIDVLRALPEVHLRAIFSPEHGLQGTLDRDGIVHGQDEASGLPVWSLYGETRKPTAEMLKDIDTIVFDIQDIGCRFYTYVSTMGECLEAAAELDKTFVVLDRPNPIGGVAMAGPILDEGKESFVGWHRLPVRHGMTAGELMRMFVGERGIRVEAKVVACEGWSRGDTYDRTGLAWIDPSPNMRSLTEALLYPGIGLLEGTNLSVGRGTDTPFERLGAPWCSGVRLAELLREQNLAGVAFVPIRFTPTASKFEGKECHGIQIAITDWKTFEPVTTGIAIATALRKLHRDDWNTEKLGWLLKSELTQKAILDGEDARTIAKSWLKDLEVFRMRRKPFLLYL